MPNNKFCKRCNKIKFTNEFNNRTGKRFKQLEAWCRECMKAYKKAYSKEQHIKKYIPHPRVREVPKDIYNQNYSLLHRHGITLDQYNQMLENQGGVCAICKRPPTIHGKRGILRLAVDHSHSTGKIRGLLCPKCNQGIGLLMDSPLFLIRAAEYLQGGANGGEQ